MRCKSIAPFFVLSVIVMIMFPAPVQAAQVGQLGDMPIDRILNAVLVIVIGFASLVGVSKLVAAIVSLLKFIPGLVADGMADRWAAGLNLFFFIGLVAFGVFRPDITLDVLDGYAGKIAEICIFVLGFLVQIAGSKPAYDAFKAARLPLLGHSNTE